ncbi:MAG: asparagine synthase (glutamine-hydrolyzing) [Candidatus Kerfeldbacteria bacterium]|nr:asparagine synthase (glutamine-hydrolyzing) [Candidatus Kerfeldbacteria bacterium]
MCGFVGQFSLQGIDQKALATAAGLLQHRGPDDSGLFADQTVGFGFRRLAILDLSPAGHQPMQNNDKTITIVHNGEIYNYLELRQELQTKHQKSFHTRSDTEVIVAAYEVWGTDCFAKFNGMWAIALWDSRRQQLVLSRDRFGEKPLYYLKRNGGFVFGSEIKALLSVTGQMPEPNQQLIFDYLVYGFHDHTDETFFSGIKQLRPGHFAVVTTSGMTIQRYWQLTPVFSKLPFDRAADQFRYLLTDSIKLRLRSDVPIGTCLSGGLDSSTIALLAHQLLRQQDQILQQKTFTAVSAEAKYDERRYSRLINTMIDAEQNEVTPDPKEFRRILPDLIWHQEEPFLSMSIFAQWEVMRRANKRGIKVLLDGQGGDEILAGYIPFFASLLAGLLRRGNVKQFAAETHFFLQHHRRSRLDILPTFALYLMPKTLGSTLLRLSNRTDVHVLEPTFKERYFRYPTPPQPFKSQLKNHLYRLLTGEGLRALLHYEDRNSMAFSIEARVPFLDYRLAEFTLGLPDSYLISHGETKRLLRAAMKNLLPPTINQRREKFGFVVAQTEWLRHELRPDLDRTFNQPSLRIGQYVNQGKIQQALSSFMNGQSGLSTSIWRWYNLEHWLKRFYG